MIVTFAHSKDLSAEQLIEYYAITAYRLGLYNWDQIPGLIEHLSEGKEIGEITKDAIIKAVYTDIDDLENKTAYELAQTLVFYSNLDGKAVEYMREAIKDELRTRTKRR